MFFGTVKPKGVRAADSLRGRIPRADGGHPFVETIAQGAASRVHSSPRDRLNLDILRLSEPIGLVASTKVFNGTVGATFSCEGSRYMQHDEFLTKQRLSGPDGMEPFYFAG